MSTVIDFQAMIEPLPGENPVGADLRASQDPDFVELRGKVDEAKRRRRAIERGDESEPPDWKTVSELASAILAKRSKDIQVLSWFLEATTRTDGVFGLAQAVRTAAVIVDRFFPIMYPLPENADDDSRLQPLIGLDNNGTGTLIPLIQQQPVISYNGQSFNLLHHQQASAIAQLRPEEKEKRLSGGASSVEQIAAAAAKMPAEQIQKLRSILEDAIAGVSSFEAALRKHCGPAAPPTSKIRETLEGALSMLKNYVKDIQPAEVSAPTPSNRADAPAGAAAAAATVTLGPIPLRREAILSAIDRLVGALDSLEPQSLAVPAIRQAVAWARMDRVELLTNLLDNSGGETARDKLFRLIGLKPPAEELETNGN